MALVRIKPEDRSQVWTASRPVRLYLDEVDELLLIGKLVGGFFLRTDAIYSPESLQSADELRPLGSGTVTEVVLHTADSSIKVTVGKTSTVEITSSDDMEAVGAFHRLQDVVKRCQRGLPLAVSGALRFLVVALGITTIILALSNNFVFLVTAPLALVLDRVDSMSRRSAGHVVLATKAEAPTFWKRHGTEIWIGLATNVLVGVVFFFIGKATGD